MAATTIKNSSWSVRRVKTLRRWRTLWALGGFLLTISFFLPESVDTFLIFPGCSPSTPPQVPVEEVTVLLEADPLSTDSLIAGAFEYLLPHIFGFMCLLIAVKSFDYRLRIQRSLGTSIPVFFAIMVIMVGIETLGEVFELNWRLDDFVPIAVSVIFQLILVIFLIRCFRFGSSGSICARWMLALLYVVYFLIFSTFLFEDPLYGNWVSLAGTSIIFISTFAEARVRCRTGFLETLWKLLRCRLELHDLSGPQCFECRYLLVGLPSNRCPECGLVFDPAEHGMDEERTGTPPGAVVSPGHARG